MTKAIEDLSGDDATAFRTALTPHINYVLDELVAAPAIEARDETVAARDAAAGYEAAASAARDDAQAASVASAAAQAGAVAAKSDAQAASVAAAAAQAGAVAAKSDAQTALADTNTAKNAALDAKTMAESARDTAIAVAASTPIQTYDTLNPDLINKVVVVGSDGFVIATIPSAVTPLTSQVYDTLAYPGKTLIVGSDGYIISIIDQSTATATAAEVTTARGSRTSLDQRLSGELTAYGLPRGPFKRMWELHRWRRDWASILYKLDSPPTRVIFAALGDSWSTGPYYWVYWLLFRLNKASGTVGGIGWCGFGDPGGGIGINGNVFITGDGNVIITKIGAWSSNYGTAPAQVHPALSDAYSSTVGDRYTITVTKNDRPALSDVILHYGGGENGVVRYRYGNGSWTTVALTGSGVQLTSLVGFPTGTGNFTLDIEVDPTSTGTVRLYGVDLVSAATGITLHKLGATGQKISQHAAASATPSWATALASLAPTQMFIGGTINDRNGGLTPAQYFSSVQTIMTNARAVLPTIEFIVWFPCEILGQSPSPTYPFATHMREYRKACEPLLDLFDGVAMVDIQYLLPGDGDPNAYSNDSNFKFLSSDKTHPTSPYGARVIEDGFYRALTCY